jgi:hypothetical protein
VSTARESEPARNAHQLSTKDGGSDQEDNIKRVNEGNSRPVEQRGSEKLPMSDGYLPSVSRSVVRSRWEQIRMSKESQLAESTHILPSRNRGAG